MSPELDLSFHCVVGAVQVCHIDTQYSSAQTMTCPTRGPTFSVPTGDTDWTHPVYRLLAIY